MIRRVKRNGVVLPPHYRRDPRDFLVFKKNPETERFRIELSSLVCCKPGWLLGLVDAHPKNVPSAIGGILVGLWSEDVRETPRLNGSGYVHLGVSEGYDEPLADAEVARTELVRERMDYLVNSLPALFEFGEDDGYMYLRHKRGWRARFQQCKILLRARADGLAACMACAFISTVISLALLLLVLAFGNKAGRSRPENFVELRDPVAHVQPDLTQFSFKANK